MRWLLVLSALLTACSGVAAAPRHDAGAAVAAAQVTVDVPELI